MDGTRSRSCSLTCDPAAAPHPGTEMESREAVFGCCLRAEMRKCRMPFSQCALRAGESQTTPFAFMLFLNQLGVTKVQQTPEDTDKIGCSGDVFARVRHAQSTNSGGPTPPTGMYARSAGPSCSVKRH